MSAAAHTFSNRDRIRFPKGYVDESGTPMASDLVDDGDPARCLRRQREESAAD